MSGATRPESTISGSTLDRLLSGGPRLTVGMITADLARLGEEMAVLESAGVELVHVDVMDGVFCPQFTVGPPIVAAIRRPILKDVHLMIDDPLAKLDAFVQAGADLITFHVEGAPQPHRVLQVLGAASNVNDPARGIVRGIAINPSTPVGAIEPLLDEVDYVLVLAVNRGNLARVAGLGADVIVSGSAIFDGQAAATNAAFMLDQVRTAGRGRMVPA